MHVTSYFEDLFEKIIVVHLEFKFDDRFNTTFLSCENSCMLSLEIRIPHSNKGQAKHISRVLK